MRRTLAAGCALAAWVMAMLPSMAAAQAAAGPAAGLNRAYTGFDKNAYPGDDLLPALRQSFAFTGYWLNDPPGMSSNPWVGKRAVLRAAGFGFLILFNGRLDAQLEGHHAARLGREDAAAAVAAAQREGFPSGAVIFLDQEEGGALLEKPAQYIGAWVAGVRRSGFRPGVYCSGVEVDAGPGVKMSTAEDLAARFPGVKLWVWNDACPPSPGCAVGQGLDPAHSGFAQAWVWQYARSPLETDTAAACRPTYAADGGCYAPGIPQSTANWLDLDASRSADPSGGR